MKPTPMPGMVLRSIVALAHDLKRAVVVEGVESGEDAAWLAQQGCEFGQGYYFSPPLSAAEALSFIARHYDVTATMPILNFNHQTEIST